MPVIVSVPMAASACGESPVMHIVTCAWIRSFALSITSVSTMYRSLSGCSAKRRRRPHSYKSRPSRSNCRSRSKSRSSSGCPENNRLNSITLVGSASKTFPALLISPVYTYDEPDLSSPYPCTTWICSVCAPFFEAENCMIGPRCITGRIGWTERAHQIEQEHDIDRPLPLSCHPETHQLPYETCRDILCNFVTKTFSKPRSATIVVIPLQQWSPRRVSRPTL